MNKPWPDIVGRYNEVTGNDPAIEGMKLLSEHIANCQLSQGLFGWTSMFDLCITQTEVTYPYDGPYLRISPQRDGNIEFRLLDTRQEDRQWHRILPAVEAVPRFLKFLDQLRWFSSEALRL